MFGRRIQLRMFAVLGLAVVAVLLVGCGPLTFVVGVKPGDQRMTSTVVRDADSWTSDRVAVIDVSGLLTNGRASRLLGEGDNPVSTFQESLDAAAKDRRVKAVILRINSPGGTVTASGLMYSAVQNFRSETGKPVVMLMMDVAASGGYYLSCAGDHVIAHPTTVTASIGVILQTISFKPALSRIGIETLSYTSGPNKAAGSPLENVSESHREVLQSMVDDFYKRFVTTVREARPNIDDATFARVTDGRAMSGDAAFEAGLVDELGDMELAFATAKKLANVDDAKLTLYHRPLSYVGSAYAASPVGATPAPGQVVIGQINVPDLNALAGGSRGGYYYLWQPQLNGSN